MLVQQIELGLNASLDSGVIPLWRCRFTKNTLVEELGGSRVEFGLWDRLFGCWEISDDGHRATEFVPEWPILSGTGMWLRGPTVADPSKKNFPISARRRWPSEAAFSAYFSTIPQVYRRLVSCLGRFQWIALDLIWQNPEFAQFLDREIFDNGPQYLYACFVFGNSTALSRRERRSLSMELMYSKRSDLLSRLAGEDCTRSFLKALPKLGDTPFDRSTYTCLLKAVKDPEITRLIAHASSLPEAFLQSIGSIPRIFFLPNVVTILTDLVDEEIGDLILYYLGEINHLSARAGGDFPVRAANSLKTAGTIDAFMEWYDKWSEHLFSKIHFPPAPLQTHASLEPLTSRSAMRSEALDMQNCLDTCVSEVLDGDVYYYRWTGDERATLCIQPVAQDRWGLAEILGFGNEQVSSELKKFAGSLVRLLSRSP
jgi:hypothetical protein